MHLIGIDHLNWIFTYVIDEVKDYYFLNYIQSLMAPRAKISIINMCSVSDYTHWLQFIICYLGQSANWGIHCDSQHGTTLHHQMHPQWWRTIILFNGGKQLHWPSRKMQRSSDYTSCLLLYLQHWISKNATDSDEVYSARYIEHSWGKGATSRHVTCNHFDYDGWRHWKKKYLILIL